MSWPFCSTKGFSQEFLPVANQAAGFHSRFSSDFLLLCVCDSQTFAHRRSLRSLTVGVSARRAQSSRQQQTLKDERAVDLMVRRLLDEEFFGAKKSKSDGTLGLRPRSFDRDM